MTAKTILIQLHHKVQTFEAINKHLVLVIQDFLLDYFRKEFQFSRLTAARMGDPIHVHAYGLSQQSDFTYRINHLGHVSARIPIMGLFPLDSKRKRRWSLQK